MNYKLLGQDTKHCDNTLLKAVKSFAHGYAQGIITYKLLGWGTNCDVVGS